MKTKTKRRLIFGGAVVVVCLLLVGHWFLQEGGLIEPGYAGQTLGYWADHAFHYSGFRRVPDADATTAIRSIGTDALPCLVKWLQIPNRTSQGIDYQQRALHGFEILGPLAKPAIPDLIKIIGKFDNYPATALSYIGSDAVPTVIGVLIANTNADFYGNWRRGIPDNLIRENAILALQLLGTNAEAAVPYLIHCLPDEDQRSRADLAPALASVGHNQPEIIVPALIYILTNSATYRHFDAIESLTAFGSKATPAVPVLWTMCQMPDAQLQIRAAVAVKTIAPQTPNALVPLIANLTNQEAQIREQALRALAALGTNGVEARETLLTRAGNEPAPEIRVLVIDLLTQMDNNEDEILRVIRSNLTNENESVACAAGRGLAKLARDSQVLFGELLSVWAHNPHQQPKSIAQSEVYEIMQLHPDFLIASLNHFQPQAALLALRFLHNLSHDTLVIDRKEPEPSTNYQVYVMRDMSDGNKRILHDAVPLLVEMLREENPEIRQLATNVLLELDPKAAKRAGIRVVPPYSFYAN